MGHCASGSNAHLKPDRDGLLCCKLCYLTSALSRAKVKIVSYTTQLLDAKLTNIEKTSLQKRSFSVNDVRGRDVDCARWFGNNVPS